MVDQITFQTISIMIAATTVVIGVVNSILTSRREEKQRQDQLLLQRFQGYDLEYTKSFNEVRTTLDWKDAEEFQQKYGYLANPEFSPKYIYIMTVYNLAEISLERGADPDLIFQLYPSMAIINLWELYEPVTKHYRKLWNYPLFMEPFEYLYNEAKKRHPEVNRGEPEMDTPRFKNE